MNSWGFQSGLYLCSLSNSVQPSAGMRSEGYGTTWFVCHSLCLCVYSHFHRMANNTNGFYKRSRSNGDFPASLTSYLAQPALRMRIYASRGLRVLIVYYSHVCRDVATPALLHYWLVTWYAPGVLYEFLVLFIPLVALKTLVHAIACEMKNGLMHRPAPTRTTDSHAVRAVPIPRTRKKQTKTRVLGSKIEIKLDSIQLEAFLVELSKRRML